MDVITIAFLCLGVSYNGYLIAVLKIAPFNVYLIFTLFKAHYKYAC